jgi:hypothetical protein
MASFRPANWLRSARRLWLRSARRLWLRSARRQMTGTPSPGPRIILPAPNSGGGASAGTDRSGKATQSEPRHRGERIPCDRGLRKIQNIRFIPRRSRRARLRSVARVSRAQSSRPGRVLSIRIVKEQTRQSVSIVIIVPGTRPVLKFRTWNLRCSSRPTRRRGRSLRRDGFRGGLRLQSHAVDRDHGTGMRLAGPGRCVEIVQLGKRLRRGIDR